jgi:hypothetical protein
MKTERDKIRLLSAAVLLAVLALGLPGFAADPPAAPEPVELKTLRMEYQQRLMKAQTPADDWYRMQLRTLLARYKQTGNLNAAVTAQAEMENPDPSKPVPADNPLPPDLAGIRNTYIVNAQRLTQPVDGWYKQQLEALERALVQRGDLAAAQAVRKTHEAKAAPDLSTAKPAPKVSAWLTPWGGRVEESVESDGVVTLKGPGKASLQSAIAVSPVEWAEGTTLECEVKVDGRSGGVLVGFDRKSALVLYWADGRSWAVAMDDHGASRKLLNQPSLKWTPGNWQKLRMERLGRDFRLHLDKSSTLIEAPAEVKGGQWGVIVHYDGSSASVRKVKLSPGTEGLIPPGGRRR